jgi:hypothetical protein
MQKILFAVVILFLAVAADAGCIKCDQSTGYWCFMSTFGTKTNCDNPTGAGCFTWGSCSPAECDYGCIENPVAAVPFSDRMQIASVSVTVPLRRS